MAEDGADIVGSAAYQVKVIDEDDFDRCLKKMTALKRPKIPRTPAVQAKIQQKTHRRTSYYLTCGRKIDTQILHEMKAEPSPFRIPPEINQVGFIDKFHEWEKDCQIQDRVGSYVSHHNYKSRLRQHKSERLYVPELTKLPGKSVTDDVDPEYYTGIAGRPIKEKKDIREYFKDVRECFLTRLKTGFQLDEILQMEEQYIEEKKRLEDIKHKYKMYMDCFEMFLREDHASSVELLKLADAETKKSKEKDGKISVLTEELSKLKAKVIILEEAWRNCKMFQKFLYSVSPLKWRRNFDTAYRKRRYKAGGVDPTDTSKFERCRGPSLTRGESLDSKIARFKLDITKVQPPALYFEHPEQLQEIFRELEKTNLLALLHCDTLTPPAQQMVAVLEKARTHFKEEQKVLEEEIVCLREVIVAEESKAREFEHKSRTICFGLLKDLIMNEEILTVTAFVEDAYEDAIAPNEHDINVIQMVKEIELKHESLLLALDTAPNDIVVEATKSFYKEQDRVMKEAHDAERRVHQMEILLKRLSKSLLYPKKGPRQRRLLFRSEPPQEIMEKMEPPKILTKAEKEQLYFFEPHCRNTDEAELYRPLCA